MSCLDFLNLMLENSHSFRLIFSNLLFILLKISDLSNVEDVINRCKGNAFFLNYKNADFDDAKSAIESGWFAKIMLQTDCLNDGLHSLQESVALFYDFLRLVCLL